MQNYNNSNMIFCGDLKTLPPTTRTDWISDSSGMIHYDSCCSIYNELHLKSKHSKIKSFMYQFKMNGCKCQHDQTYWQEKEERYKTHILQKTDDGIFLPPPLNYKLNWPECCMYDIGPSLRWKNSNYTEEAVDNDEDVKVQFEKFIKECK